VHSGGQILKFPNTKFSKATGKTCIFNKTVFEKIDSGF